MKPLPNVLPGPMGTKHHVPRQAGHGHLAGVGVDGHEHDGVRPAIELPGARVDAQQQHREPAVRAQQVVEARDARPARSGSGVGVLVGPAWGSRAAAALRVASGAASRRVPVGPSGRGVAAVGPRVARTDRACPAGPRRCTRRRGSPSGPRARLDAVRSSRSGLPCWSCARHGLTGTGQ